MHSAAGGASAQSEERNDGYRELISDLVSLIEQVQAGIGLLELAVARENPSCLPEAPANIVVLDDVTPRYVQVSAALSNCKAGLGTALDSLLDSRPSTDPQAADRWKRSPRAGIGTRA